MAGVMVGGEKETGSDDELITYIPYDTRHPSPHPTRLSHYLGTHGADNGGLGSSTRMAFQNCGFRFFDLLSVFYTHLTPVPLLVCPGRCVDGGTEWVQDWIPT